MDDNSLYRRTSCEYCTDLGPGLDDGIRDLVNRQARLSGWIDRCWDDLSVRELAMVLAAHGRTAVRLGQLLRDGRAPGFLGRLLMCIDNLIADLGDKLGRLSRHIDDQWPDLDKGNVKPWSRLVTVYSQNCVRLGELKQIRRALGEESPSDELDEVINAALDRLSEEWGIEL